MDYDKMMKQIDALAAKIEVKQDALDVLINQLNALVDDMWNRRDEIDGDLTAVVLENQISAAS